MRRLGDRFSRVLTPERAEKLGKYDVTGVGLNLIVSDVVSASPRFRRPLPLCRKPQPRTRRPRVSLGPPTRARFPAPGAMLVGAVPNEGSSTKQACGDRVR